MAALKWKYIRAVLAGSIESATVGNNRCMHRQPNGVVSFTLHGHPVAMLAPGSNPRVTFDPCGHPTPTTASAMKDAALAFDIGDIGPSFAKGRFTIRRGHVTYVPDMTGRIYIFRDAMETQKAS